MKKTLRFSLLALLALFGMGSAMAEDFKEVITLNDAAAIQALGIQLPEAGKGTKVESITKGEVNIACQSGGTDTRIYQGSGGNAGQYDFRIYKDGGSLTFTAGNYFVKKIEFTGKNLDKLSGDNYTDGTWIGSGSDRSITLTATGTATIYTITVTYGESGAVQAEPGETAETAISVREALAIIDQLADKETTSKSYYVKGTVASVTEISVGYGNATFVLGDGSTTNNLTAYQLKGFNNEKINNEKLFKVNDELIVVGKLQKFVDNAGATTPEIKSGYIYSVNGQTEDNTPSPEEAVKAGKVGLDAENPMTVDQALAYINDFPASYITEGKYYVEGTVTAIQEISTEKGNATFTIAASQINAPRRASFSELVAFRLKGLENQAIVEDDYLKVGDEVVVCAQLQNYKDEKAELSGGYIYKKNGETSGIQAITVDDAKAPVYSLDGRRVDESYRGVVIKNGKKYVK